MLDASGLNRLLLASIGCLPPSSNLGTAALLLQQSSKPLETGAWVGRRRIQLFNPWCQDEGQAAAAFEEASAAHSMRQRAVTCPLPFVGHAQLPRGFFWIQWPAFHIWFQSMDLWQAPPKPSSRWLKGLQGLKGGRGAGQKQPTGDTIWSWTLSRPIERGP